MSCSEVRELLSAFIDGELEPSETAKVSSHLKNCPECAADLKALEDVVASLRSLPDLDPPEELLAGVREKIKGIPAAPARKRRRYATGWIVAAAAFLVVLAAAGVFFSQALMPVNQSAVSEEKASLDMAPMVAPESAVKGAPQMILESKDSMSRSAASPGVMALTPAPEYEKKIIKNAALRIRVEDAAAAYDEVVRLAQSMGGDIQNGSLSSNNQRHTATLTVRIPADRFEEFLEKVKDFGEVLNKDMSMEEVTAQYVDLQSRLRALQTTETRLLELYNRANTIGEVIQVQSELTRVQSDIESLKGQMNYLQNRISYSTVQLTLFEENEAEPSPSDDILTRIWKAFIASWHALGRRLERALIWLGGLAPYAIVLAALYAGYRLLRRNKTSGTGGE